MNLCYIFRRNTITTSTLQTAEILLNQFHQLRQFFIDAGVRSDASLPRQHALPHYLISIPLFGSPNGLCSSITESKHIKAVKEPWRRSSRYKALIQMLRTITRLDKVAALRQIFFQQGMLAGSTAAYTAQALSEANNDDNDEHWCSHIHGGHEGGVGDDGDDDGEARGKEKDDRGDLERLNDAGPVAGPHGLSSIVLAATPGAY